MWESSQKKVNVTKKKKILSFVPFPLFLLSRFLLSFVLFPSFFCPVVFFLLSRSLVFDTFAFLLFFELSVCLLFGSVPVFPVRVVHVSRCVCARPVSVSVISRCVGVSFMVRPGRS